MEAEGESDSLIRAAFQGVMETMKARKKGAGGGGSRHMTSGTHAPMAVPRGFIPWSIDRPSTEVPWSIGSLKVTKSGIDCQTRCISCCTSTHGFYQWS